MFATCTLQSSRLTSGTNNSFNSTDLWQFLNLLPNLSLDVVHDLFDFEAHHLHTKTFTVSRSTKCIRTGTEVQMLSEMVPPPLGSDLLLRLVQKDGMFWVDKASPSSSTKKLWMVVRDLPTCGHKPKPEI